MMETNGRVSKEECENLNGIVVCERTAHGEVSGYMKRVSLLLLWFLEGGREVEAWGCPREMPAMGGSMGAKGGLDNGGGDGHEGGVAGDEGRCFVLMDTN